MNSGEIIGLYNFILLFFCIMLKKKLIASFALAWVILTSVWPTFITASASDYTSFAMAVCRADNPFTKTAQLVNWYEYDLVDFKTLDWDVIYEEFNWGIVTVWNQFLDPVRYFRLPEKSSTWSPCPWAINDF